MARIHSLMSALTNYSKWDSIHDSSDDESVDLAPKDDPTLVAARNVVRELKHRLALLDRAADSVSDRVSDSALDEGWTSPPLPGGASRQQLFTATCLRLEFPGVFSNEPEAACPHVDTLSKEDVRYLRVTRPNGRATHVYAHADEIHVVPLVNEVEAPVERVHAFLDGRIRYFDRDRATKVVASSAKISTLHAELIDAVETAAMLGPGAPTPWLSGASEDEFVVREVE